MRQSLVVSMGRTGLDMKKSYSSKHWKRFPGRYKDYLLQRNFGITLEDYNALLAAQSNACAICQKLNGSCIHSGERTKQLAVDHDHESGAVRGLLCNDCNRAIGQFREDPELLRKAADYLEFHRELFKKTCEGVDGMLAELSK